MEVDYEGLKFKLFEEHLQHTQNMPLKDRFLQKVYEKPEIEGIRKYVKLKDNVLDLGGSLGVTSCVAAKHIKGNGTLVSVEANPRLIESIKYNRDLNGLDFYIFHGAASYNNRNVKFNFNSITQSGSIVVKNHLIGDVEKLYGKYQNIELITTTPMDLEKKYGVKFNCLNCDIEGEEYALLFNLFDYFKSFNSILVEFHHHLNPQDYNKYYTKIIQLYSPIFNIITVGRTKFMIKK